MAQPLLDQILKAMAEKRPKPLVHMVFPQSDFKVISSKFEFVVVKLWEYLDAILAGKKQYLPFVPFVHDISPKPDVAVLHQQPELISLEKNPELRDELLGFSLLLAQRHFARELVKEVFTQEKHTMNIVWEDVPFIGDRLIEIKAQTLQKNLQEVLATRFGVTNGRVSRLINSIHEPQKLEAVFRRSLKAKSLDAVVEMLQKAKPPAGRKSEK